jgi:hypothetical protein
LNCTSCGVDLSTVRMAPFLEGGSPACQSGQCSQIRKLWNRYQGSRRHAEVVEALEFLGVQSPYVRGEHPPIVHPHWNRPESTWK